MDECILDHLGRRDRLREALVALVRYGSFERGDFVPGLSDLDYFAVVDRGAVAGNEAVREAVVDPLTEVLETCAEGIDHRGVDVAWEYRDNLGDPDAGVRFKFLTAYQADFRRHHTLVYGEDVFPELPAVEFDEELPVRLDRIERLVEERGDSGVGLRMLAGETARLRALRDGAGSLRKADVREALAANDRDDALRVYDAYLDGTAEELDRGFLRSFVRETVAALRGERTPDRRRERD